MNWEKKIRIKYPAGHSYDETWKLDADMFCPHCGKRGVWIEQGPGDYYVGEMHVCMECRWMFHLPSYGGMSGPIDDQRIAQLS